MRLGLSLPGAVELPRGLEPWAQCCGHWSACGFLSLRFSLEVGDGKRRYSRGGSGPARRRVPMMREDNGGPRGVPQKDRNRVLGGHRA